MLLIIEIAIATFISEGFVRSNFGDFLVVILIYCFIKSLFDYRPLNVACGVLLFAFIVEFLQLSNILVLFNLQKNIFAKIILGSTFQITDLIAYTLGFVSILIIEYKLNLSNFKS